MALLGGGGFVWAVTEHKMCLLIFLCKLLSVTFLILRRIQRDIIKILQKVLLQNILVIVTFLRAQSFWTDFSKKKIHSITIS